MRRVVLAEASHVVARTPEALKLKAAMQEDYFDQIPSIGPADLLRLRDLAQ